MDSLRRRASSGAMDMTTDVVALFLSSGFGLRNLVAAIVAPHEKPIASLIVFKSSAGSEGSTCTGRLWIT